MRRKWDTAHVNLRRIYDQRVNEARTKKEREAWTQKAFAKRIGVGQSMVAMILAGDRPLPLDLAPRFATELGCKIYEISPEMGDYITEELLPVLGKALRRAAMVLLTIGLLQFAPSDAYASSVLHNAVEKTPLFAKCMNSLHIVALWFRRIARRIIASCALTHLFHEHRTF